MASGSGYRSRWLYLLSGWSGAGGAGPDLLFGRGARSGVGSRCVTAIEFSDTRFYDGFSVGANSAGLCRLECQPGVVRLSGVLGALVALGGGQLVIRVNLALEFSEQ